MRIGRTRRGADKSFDEKRSWEMFTESAPTMGELADAADQRHELEKPPISKEDGRRKRSTGRTAVFNTKLKPEFRDRIFAMAKRQGIGLAALLEEIVETYGEEWEKKRKRAGASNA